MFQWKCSTGRPYDGGMCSPPMFVNGHIKGKEYRTKDCYWGGGPCADYHNNPSTREYCDSPDTRVCPLDNQVVDSNQSNNYEHIFTIPVK